MTEFESMPSPNEKIVRPQFKTSNRQKIQDVVDRIEEAQEVKHPDIDDAHAIRQIARDIAAPTILAERRAQKLKNAEEESKHDIRTGLLNRRGYEEALKKAVARAERDGTPLSVLLGDIRDLGKINNDLSMEAGDALIATSGAVVASALRESDEGAMWGGDEIGVIYPNTGLSEALIAASRIAETLAQPQTLTFNFKGQETELVMPIGFRGVVGQIDPKNASASEAVIKEELSAMKNEEKKLRAQGQPIGGNNIVSIGIREQAA